MPSKLKREDIAKIENLPDAVKADITALFTDIEERDASITDLKKKNADADEVVKRAPAIEAANKELTAKKLELEGLLAQHTTKPKDEISLAAFAPFFDR